MNAGIFLGFMAACAYGSAAVFARIGLKSLPAGAVTLLGLWAGFICLIITIFSLNQHRDLLDVEVSTLSLMALLGVTGFCLGRFSFYRGISYIGVARATPIVASNPLVSTVLAITLGGEKLHFLTGIGTIAIIGGISLILSESLSEKIQTVKKNDKTTLIIGYFISLVASICYGIAGFLGKILVNESITPIVSTIYATFFASIVLGILVRKEIKSIAKAGFKSIICASLAGIGASFALTFYFWGVELSSLTTVAPLIALQALVAMTLTHLFLQKMERITPKIFFGTFLVAIGVALIIFASNID